MALHSGERWKFGRFYYRFPDGGESCADVFDRVSSFMESMYRYFEDHSGVQNYVMVMHGISIAVFLMRFLKYDVDEFCEYKNFTNCEFAVLERNADGWLEFAFGVRNESGSAERYTERAKEPEEWRTKRNLRYE